MSKFFNCERAVNHPKIEIKTHRTVKSWLSDDNGLTGAVLEDPRDGSTETVNCSGAFIAIGHKPITKFLDNQVETDDSGYILHKRNTMTSIEGVFAAGDVVDTRYRQAITAAGMGCQAAIDAEGFIQVYEKDLGIRLALDQTVEKWGGRMLFFRLNQTTIEVIARPNEEQSKDSLWGLAWDVEDLEAH